MYRPQIKWEFNESQIENVEHLILVEGRNAHKLIQNALDLKKDSKLVCSIRNVQVFELKDKTTFLCIAEEQDLNYSASISDYLEIFSKRAKEVTLVSLQSLAEFKSDKLPEDCIIKGINSKFDDIEPLAAPNFITGINAGVCTSRFLLNASFSCYVVYVDFYDEISIRKILYHIKRIGLNFDENVKIKPLNQNSNLYM